MSGDLSWPKVAVIGAGGGWLFWQDAGAAGRAGGVATPLNHALYMLVKLQEQGFH